MIYKANIGVILENLKGIIFFLLLAIVAIVLFAGDFRSVVVIVVISLSVLMPQLYLAIQYIAHCPYDSFEIDYNNENFIVKESEKVITRSFSSLITIQYHKANVPSSYLSLAFTLCEYFYYYRLEFTDGKVYYLSNILSPNPSIDGSGVFYRYFFKVDRKYATIKR
ncbi:MAG: hypothetical protein ACQUHE_10800 [Bacteroidia bacterium]